MSRPNAPHLIRPRVHNPANGDRGGERCAPPSPPTALGANARKGGYCALFSLISPREHNNKKHHTDEVSRVIATAASSMAMRRRTATLNHDVLTAWSHTGPRTAIAIEESGDKPSCYNCGKDHTANYGRCQEKSIPSTKTGNYANRESSYHFKYPDQPAGTIFVLPSFRRDSIEETASMGQPG
ncbi:hypothetical protein EVAR_63812_1 [Eumeta japonica]|uniref:Uncharacterized protein n=1 Tax=Eumeta variegata TaxID=151549 RepID=A0A4C1ZY96_EUMVA|nr:hypothetical protein EVAR_63812_1 [Eumeta japonica]